MIKNSSKGFTLVELLIVVVIIGVLSSMMSISSTSATDNAKASAIIANLSTMKKAALALYMESQDIANATESSKVLEGIASYVGTTSNALKNTNHYNVDVNGTEWYVYYETQVNNVNLINTTVKNILKDKAESVGLLGADSIHFNSTTYYDGQKKLIGMKVR